MNLEREVMSQETMTKIALHFLEKTFAGEKASKTLVR